VAGAGVPKGSNVTDLLVPVEEEEAGKDELKGSG
jgi:hypothetical protein